MAIVRRILTGSPGQPVFWFEYDDLASRLWVTAVGCDNPTNFAGYAEAYMAGDGSRKVSSTFLAQTNTSIVVPTNVAARQQLFINTSGKLDGVVFTTTWPVP